MIMQVVEDLECVACDYCGVGGALDEQIELAYPDS